MQGEDGRREETAEVKKNERSQKVSGREEANDFDLPLEAAA